MLFGKKTINSIQARFDFDKRRRITKIVVIDDDPTSYEPFEPLRDEGYIIDYWEKIRELGKLERGEYDIIILDIKGVGQEWSPEEGFGIMDLLKSRNPLQIIIAYSGETFDLGKKKFFRMADDMIPKATITPAICKRVIDNLIETKLSPKPIWDSIKKLLSEHGVSNRKMAQIEHNVVQILEHSPNQLKIEEVLKNVVKDEQLWSSIILMVFKLVLSVS